MPDYNKYPPPINWGLTIAIIFAILVWVLFVGLVWLLLYLT